MKANSTQEKVLLIHDIGRAHRNAINLALARQGLQDVAQPKVLILLSSLTNGTVNQRSLADALHISPATMANSLHSLEQKGYVSRVIDPKDSRCKLVSITPKGADAVQHCLDAFGRVDRQAYAGFTEEELLQMRHFCQRMLANLYAIGGDKDPEGCTPLPPPIILNERK